MTKNEISRGDIWWVDWSPGRGSEQEGRRPALVVQTDAANRNPNYPNTIVVTISRKGRELPFHIRLAPSAQNGLSSLSFAKCEQVMTISKQRLEKRIGRISEQELAELARGLRLVLSI